MSAGPGDVVKAASKAPPIDGAARESALDPAGSFIVQAPAGSGKTELLTRRLLSLLAIVDAPEEILAITFTRKAAAEMRERVIDTLAIAARAGHGDAGDVHPIPEERLELGRKALARSHALGWELMENPGRLRISTIDGLNSYLVGRMPWLSRLGASPGICATPNELYEEAADRVIRTLDSANEYADALERVLNHLDNRTSLLRDYVVRFLMRRDQWLRHRRNLMSLGKPEELRPVLEEGLRELVATVLRANAGGFLGQLDTMLELARYAAGNLEDDNPLSLFRDFDGRLGLEPERAPFWRALTGLFLTKSGTLRRKVDKNSGFPAGKGEATEYKEQFKALLETFDEADEAALKKLAALPEPHYPEDNWEIIEPIIRVADLALGHLWTVMRERGETDFSENAQRAIMALGNSSAPSELLLALDRKIAHILVDEFQDTSRLQFELLKLLTSGWTPGDGRTLFLVGDPMQSIYRFREADVGLFATARDEGVSEVSLTPLGLTVNFRSQAPVVESLNEIFSEVFPAREDPALGAVTFTPAAAHKLADGNYGIAVEFTPMAARDYEAEAAELADEVERALRADTDGDSTVAVLVRARTHLSAVIAELKRRKIPFRGEDLDPLRDSAAARDVLSLARALVDPADGLSWLSVLRAPWCGLPLADMHTLFAGDSRNVGAVLDDVLGPGAVGEGVGISADAARALGRVWPVLRESARLAYRRPFGVLLRATWATLGAPAYLDEQQLDDAEAALELITDYVDGGLPELDGIDAALEELYGKPDPLGGNRLAVMTIHKAKGLEFDTVLIPGLGRQPRRNDTELISWEETGSGKLVIGAAKAKRVGAESPVADLISLIGKERNDHEALRLLYVAATRAKRRLVMWGHAAYRKSGWTPLAGSLLERLWPAVEDSFESLDPPDKVEREESCVLTPLVTERLPVEWTLPPLHAPELVRSETEGVTPAANGDGEEPILFEWAREVRKHVGTVSHALFERMARETPGRWTAERVEAERGSIGNRLVALGVGQEELAEAVEDVVRAATAILEDPAGRRVLEGGEGAASELALTGVFDGEVRTRIVDRTYIDEAGVRWIVDFKVASHAGGGIEQFLEHEKARYRSQLAGYARLFRAREPGREVRAALYYPLLRRFVEVAV